MFEAKSRLGKLSCSFLMMTSGKGRPLQDPGRVEGYRYQEIQEQMQGEAFGFYLWSRGRLRHCAA